MQKAFASVDTSAPGSGKWVHMFDVAERHLARFRGTDVVICEIGVHHGGSLRFWREYFGPKATIIGVDVFNSSFMHGNPLYGSPHMIEMSMLDPKFWPMLQRIAPRLDILIDDSGHTWRLQHNSIENAIPILAPGGVYICEDIIDGASATSVIHLAAKRFITDTATGFFKFRHSASLIQNEHDLTDAQKNLFGFAVYPHMIVIEKMSTPRKILRTIEIGSVHIAGKRPVGTRLG